MADTASLKLFVTCAEKLSQNKTDQSFLSVADIKVLFTKLTANSVSAQELY